MLFGSFFQLALLCVLLPLKVSGFYYYGNGGERKCFNKELSKGTLLEIQYNVQIYDEALKAYLDTGNREFDVLIDVEETFDDNHRVAHQKLAPSGAFPFVAAESGDHKVCILPQATKWMSKGKTKVNIEFVIGQDGELDSKKKTTLQTLHNKVNILNDKVAEIRREQKLIREREAQFRDASESVNSHAMWWTLIQLIVLGGTCAWQMRHLRSFFVKQKVL